MTRLFIFYLSIISLDLEWRMIYVGAAESSEYDQVLDSIMVGPIPVGVNKFVFSVSISFSKNIKA
jgi:hypothetical protein